MLDAHIMRRGIPAPITMGKAMVAHTMMEMAISAIATDIKRVLRDSFLFSLGA